MHVCVYVRAQVYVCVPVSAWQGRGSRNEIVTYIGTNIAHVCVILQSAQNANLKKEFLNLSMFLSICVSVYLPVSLSVLYTTHKMDTP